jgi:hypothetical protein
MLINKQKKKNHLVNDHDAVWTEVRFGEELSQEHTVRHVLDHSPLTCAVLKSDAVPHLVACQKHKIVHTKSMKLLKYADQILSIFPTNVLEVLRLRINYKKSLKWTEKITQKSNKWWLGHKRSGH